MPCLPRDFTGSLALVTGGTRGLGAAIAAALGASGAEVHILDPAEPGPETPAEAHHHRVDVCDGFAVGRVIATLPRPCRLLVNNAGITRDRTLAKMTDEDWDQVLRVNLTGAFVLTRAVAPIMAAAGGGRIVNITSINGLRGKFGQANYAASKAGLIALTKTTAREFGAKGVTANAVAPGMVMTEMARRLPPEVLDKARAEALLPDLAQPEDVAAAVLFLLSDAARAITGQVVQVDAGQYL